MNIGEKMQYFMKEKGIKAYKMAKKVGVSEGNVYEILNGKNKNPGVYTVKKISDYLGVKVDDLI